MNWSTREWYPVLVRGRDLVLTPDWVLYQSGASEVQMVHHSGAMCRAVVEADGVCRVRTTLPNLPNLDETVPLLHQLLNLR